MDNLEWQALTRLEIECHRRNEVLSRKRIQDFLGCTIAHARLVDFALKNKDIIRAKPIQLPFEGERVLVLNDIHIPYQDDAAVEAALTHAEAFKPTTIILLGDVLDFYRCSRFMKKTGKPDINSELKQGREFLTNLRMRFSDAKIILKEGNHESHLERYILENAVEIADLLKDLLIQKLNLPTLNISYVRDFFQIGKLWFLHGHEKPQGGGNAEYITNVVFKYVLDHCIFGHWHRTQEKIFKRIDGSTLWCGANGHLSGPMEYAPINNWSQGFCTIVFSNSGAFSAKLHKIEGGVIY